MACIRQRLFERRDDQPAHQPGIAETHFGFRRMHVHVHERRIAFQEQRQRRMAVAREEIRISAAHRADQQLVAHGPSVHEEELHLRVGAVVGRQSREARDVDAFARHIHRRGIVAEIVAHDFCKTLQAACKQIGFRFQIERASPIQRQRERHIGP